MNPSLCVTSYLAGARLPDALQAGGIVAPDVSGLVSRLARLLVRPARVSEQAAAPLADRVLAQIEAIRSYAEFLRQHPDMPSYHRERCLASALRECRRLEQTIARSGEIHRISRRHH